MQATLGLESIGIMEHTYHKIKGWFNWPEMYTRAVHLAPKKAVFVEIGCFRGKSTACLAVEAWNSGKEITIHAIDLWDTTKKIGCTVKEFMGNIPKFGGSRPSKRVTINPIQMDSKEAANLFKDRSIDFVWIDGDHRYSGCIGDIRAWWPKLKDGGWMGGDDLIHGGVRPAVEEFFGAECLPNSKDVGDWVRFQSATCHAGKGHLVPVSGGWVWWARSKGLDWRPVGL